MDTVGISRSVRDSTEPSAFLRAVACMEPLALKYSFLNSPPLGIVSVRASLEERDAAKPRRGWSFVDCGKFRSLHLRHIASASKNLSNLACRDRGNIPVIKEVPI